MTKKGKDINLIKSSGVFGQYFTPKDITRDSEEYIWLSNRAIYLIKPHQESPTEGAGHRNGG